MKCPICQKELEIKNKKVGETAAGEAIYNEFAICHDCKKQWNLDKQRAKKNTPAEKPKAPVSEDAPAPKKKKKRPAPQGESAAKPRKKRPVSKEDGSDALVSPTVSFSVAVDNAVASGTADAQERPRKKKRPVSQGEHAAAPESGNTERPKKKKRPVSQDPGNTSSGDGAPAKTPDKAAKAEPKPRPKKKRPVDAAEKPIRPEREGQAKKPSRPAGSDQAEKTARPASPSKRPQNTLSGKSGNIKSAARAMEEPIEEFSDALEESFDAQPKAKKRKAAANASEEQTYSNIPPKDVREKREKEMRENYQNMLDEGLEDEDEGHFPTVLIVILVLLILAAAAFAGYWFLLRGTSMDFLASFLN